MKPKIKSAIIPFLSAILILSSCSKNGSDNSPIDNNNNNTTNSSAFITGNFTITSYTQRTENKTSSFNGAVFTFSSNGTLLVAMNGSTITGTWIYYPSSVGYYGSAPTDASITLSLGTSAPMNRLNRRWNIQSSTSTSVILINPEPNDDEHITFTKQQ